MRVQYGSMQPRPCMSVPFPHKKYGAEAINPRNLRVYIREVNDEGALETSDL